MNDQKWIKIVSWHVEAGISSRTGAVKVLCGRWADEGAEASDTLPAGKSCEGCLRVLARRTDNA